MQKNFNLEFILFSIISAIVLFFSISFLQIPLINFGQLAKQTFASEMINGFIRNDVQSFLFPIRHFLEPHHQNLIPWAEEFPIFHLTIKFFHQFISLFSNSITPIVIARYFSFIGFGFLVAGFFRIGKTFIPMASTNQAFIFAIVAISFPVFRLYSTQVIPDIWMTALCVWSIERTIVEKHKSAAILICFASLFKYYAAFTALGLGLFHAYRWISKKSKSSFFHGLWIALAILPCVSFIYYFIHKGIPNPITEYRNDNGHGHLSSIHGVFQLHKWSRVGLWIFVKNSSIAGTLLAIYGFYRYREKIPPILVCLMIGWGLFPITFIESFYIHDYYGLQASIGTAIFASLGLMALNKSKKAFLPVLIIFAIWSTIQVRSMSKPLIDYEQIIKEYPVILKNLGQKPRRGLIISGISKPSLPHMLHLDSWISSYPEANKGDLSKILQRSELDIVMIHGFLNEDDETRKIQKIIESTGNMELITDRTYTKTRLIVFAKKN